jgi:four helix bundle protein
MKEPIRRFEDIVAWQCGRKLVADIYKLSNDQPFCRDFALRDQIRRSAISIPSNIAEGFERWTLPEFRRFLSIAKGSCGELRTQVYLAADLGYLDPQQADSLMRTAQSVVELIGKLRSSIDLRRTQDAGHGTQDP